MTIKRMFIHGLESSSQGKKAALLRTVFPELITPDFTGPLQERMTALSPLLADHDDWILVGSSFGGLMAALWACAHPAAVRKLVLLAPAIHRPEFADALPPRNRIPTTLFHGSRDDIVPPVTVRDLAQRVFLDLTYHLVDDEHALRKTAAGLDWASLLAP